VGKFAGKVLEIIPTDIFHLCLMPSGAISGIPSKLYAKAILKTMNY